MTQKIYLEDSDRFQAECLIVQFSEDEKGTYLVLDQTVFYPQGGGQPCDHGIVKNDAFEATITHVAQIQDEIRHYTTSSIHNILLGSKVYCSINQERRLHNTRYHSAAHLLGNIVETLYPQLKAVKGHSFPGEAYVEFQDKAPVDPIVIQNTINEAIQRNDKTKIFEMDPASFEQKFYKLSYYIPEDKKFRAVQIGDLLPVPCGGTHVSSIGEIGNISIGKIKARNNGLRISYALT